MKRALSVVVVLALAMVWVGWLEAQTRTPSTRGIKKQLPEINQPTIPPDVSTGVVLGQQVLTLPGLDSGIVLEGSDDASKAFRVVVAFLQLRSDQAMALKELLQIRHETVVPLLEEIRARQQEIQELLETGGDAASIGQLVIEIHEFQQLVARAQQDFMANFLDLLDPEQKERFQRIVLAHNLEPLLPAFRLLHLLPPRPQPQQ